MEQKKIVNRRKAIKQASYLLGIAVSGPALAGVLNGCTSNVRPDWQPQFMTQEEAALVAAISARIIPAGDTPGAVDAGVPQFIDVMLAEYYLPKDQEQFRSGLAALEAQSQAVLQKNFVDGSEEEQDQVLTEQASLAKQQLQASPESTRHFFLMIKELTLLGFFTSEIGATQTLQFDEIPGGFQGCVPLESVGGETWAT